MKAFLFVVIACLIAATMAAPLSEESYQYLFTKFVAQYNKKYETNSVFERYNIFRQNLDLIMSHNARPSSEFKMGINFSADLTATEFSQMMGLKVSTKPQVAAPAPCPMAQMPKIEYIDWRTKNVINPVKNQQSCGSCWAFSAACPLEAMNKLNGGELYDLAEQQFVDCVNSDFDPSFISEGCNGGLMSEAVKFAAKNGVCQTSEYPYTARDGVCKTSCQTVVQPKTVKELKGDAALQQAVLQGPVSVGLAASSSAFQFYSSGVVSSCTDRSLNHGVVLVGIAQDEASGADYYIIRNSWGASWGYKGHIHLSVKGNQCGLGTSPWDVQPVF